MSAALSEGALDTREEFEGTHIPRGRYPRSFRRAVAHGRWERASWLEARHAERWLSRLVLHPFPVLAEIPAVPAEEPALPLESQPAEEPAPTDGIPAGKRGNSGGGAPGSQRHTYYLPSDLQVTLYGRPLGRKVYVDEILDAMSSWCPEMTSRRAKRQAGKARRRARLRAARGDR